MESNQVEVQGIDKASEIAGDAYGSSIRRSLTTIQYLNIYGKINVKGVAICQICNKHISYAGRGWKCLEQHLTK